MSRGGGTTLYVTGFGQGTRARDLAYEFERFGRLVRCDIPAPRTASSRLFAFVEYESRRDADEAYHEMHNQRIGRDDLLKIEWARTPPSASWRFDAGAGRGPPRDGGRRSPRRARSGSPPRRSGRDGSPRGDRYEDRRGDRRGADRRDRDRSRSPDERDTKDIRDREEPRDRDDNEVRAAENRESETDKTDKTDKTAEPSAEHAADQDTQAVKDEPEPNGTNGAAKTEGIEPEPTIEAPQ